MTDPELRELRRKLDSIPRGRGRRIPLELRAQVTAWMAKHRKRGDSWSELVRQTGVRGVPRLVESDRAKRARSVAVTLPQDAPIPITEEVGKGLGELTLEAEERVYQHLAAVASNDPLVLAGQVVGLLCVSECLLALLPSNKVAAFCVQLASMSAAADAR